MLRPIKRFTGQSTKHAKLEASKLAWAFGWRKPPYNGLSLYMPDEYMRPPKLTPKIILEGTRLTHKTDLVFAINDHPRIVGPKKYRYHSPIISAEWCTFNNVPWGRGPILALASGTRR